jgi:acetylornithine deacetylase/succinyl-diaminopimelate desuccinylase family protein
MYVGGNSVGIYRQRLKTLLEKLVAIASVTGNELEVAILLQQYFKEFDIEGNIDFFAQNSGNFVVPYITNPNKKALIMCSHIDVVPEGDQSFWNSNPFTLTEKDGLWFGRGSCDAKGSIAAMATAFLEIIKKRDFNGNIIFVAVSGEEKGSTGAKRFIEKFGPVDGCVMIGEPTDATVSTSQKGRIEFIVDVMGIPGHASRPEKAKNAVMAAAELLHQLKPYIDNTNRIADSYAGKASIAVTLADTVDTNATTIPGLCRLVFDRRWTYIERPEDIINGFIAQVNRIADRMGIKTKVSSRIGIPAAYTQPDAKIIQCALQACEVVKKKKSKPSGFPAGCDMFVFANAGIDTIVLGSGNLYDNSAHGYNEFIAPEDLEQMVAIYIETVEKYFG